MDILHSILDISTKLTYKYTDTEITYQYLNTSVTFKYELSNTELKLAPLNNDNLSEHIIRVLISLKIDNDPINIIQNLINIISNPYIFCTICGKKIGFVNEQIRSCDPSFEKYGSAKLSSNLGDQCADIFYESKTDNIISDQLKKDNFVLYFLVKTAITCLYSARVEKVFNPRPLKYTSLANIEKLKKKINDANLETVIRDFGDKSEKEIYTSLGKELYGFVKYIILSNKTEIMSEKLDKSFFDDPLELNKEQDKSLNKLLNFQINYDQHKIDKRFTETKPHYVFHGSNIGNWYSIMRNGLKNYSGTDMMVNGAAFGQGIYFGKSAQMSFGYSNKNLVGTQNIKIDGAHKNDAFNMVILGVVQLLEPEKYDKGNGMYVVPDEHNVLLKYIVLLDAKDLSKIETYYKDRAKNIGDVVLNGHTIIAKRLKKEYEKCIKNGFNDSIKISDVDYNIWNITINDNMFVFNFGKSYPVEPPLIKIMIKKNGRVDNVTTSDQEIKMKEMQDWNIKKDVLYIIKLLERY